MTRRHNTRTTGFTVVELLVVMSIIVLLISILLPSMERVRNVSRRTVCLSQLHQVHIGTINYATDSFQWYPYRTGDSLPQQIADGNRYNFNETLVDAYLAKRNHLMFCPTRLNDVRGPEVAPFDYWRTFVTYHFYSPPQDGFRGNYKNAWAQRVPTYGTLSKSNSRLPLWSCLTHQKQTSQNGWLAGSWLAHDRALELEDPEGMNFIRVDGSATWADFTDTEPFVRSGNGVYWWPKTVY